ncbi:MAG: c-type cytochrome [Bdellovibrionaceae bacterium]|nr:c-type cytochrome [Pseudobdellovibrionaceae bacterium]MDW8190373.1 c-type cytochrome [Pseudobdellovibrionaceae bacterium]
MARVQPKESVSFWFFFLLLFLSLIVTGWSLKVARSVTLKHQVWGLITVSLDELPSHANSEQIMLGLDLIKRTSELLPEWVGAKLNCTNCHLNAGTKPLAGPFIGILRRFPQYRDRSGKIDTIEDRINDCFERSLNGKRLPMDHPALLAIKAYMEWLSRDYPFQAQQIEGMGMPKLVLNRPPHLDRGRQVYEQKCQQCHQSQGQGLIDPKGVVQFPPLWGEYSFNVGAGMARLHTAAGFVKHHMPLGQEGSLSDDEAWDVAAFFSQQPRPDFAKKHLDWPKGNKPPDARY